MLVCITKKRFSSRLWIKTSYLLQLNQSWRSDCIRRNFGVQLPYIIETQFKCLVHVHRGRKIDPVFSVQFKWHWRMRHCKETIAKAFKLWMKCTCTKILKIIVKLIPLLVSIKRTNDKGLSGGGGGGGFDGSFYLNSIYLVRITWI